MILISIRLFQRIGWSVNIHYSLRQLIDWCRCIAKHHVNFDCYLSWYHRHFFLNNHHGYMSSYVELSCKTIITLDLQLKWWRWWKRTAKIRIKIFKPVFLLHLDWCVTIAGSTYLYGVIQHFLLLLSALFDFCCCICHDLHLHKKMIFCCGINAFFDLPERSYFSWVVHKTFCILRTYTSLIKCS